MRTSRLGPENSLYVCWRSGDIYDCKLFLGTQVQVKTFQERIKKQEEIIEQLREDASYRGDASMLHNELMDLENLYSNGKKGETKMYKNAQMSTW